MFVCDSFNKPTCDTGCVCVSKIRRIQQKCQLLDYCSKYVALELSSRQLFITLYLELVGLGLNISQK